MGRLFKKNKVYLFIFLILVIVFFVLWLQDLNVFYVCGRYLKEPDYRVWISHEINRVTGAELSGVFHLAYALMTWPVFSVDTGIPGMDLYSAIVLPVLASIGSYHLFTRLNREYQLSIHRSGKLDRFIVSEIAKESFKLSCALFAAIAVNVLIIFSLQYEVGEGILPMRVLLTDIIPASFIQVHPLFFYLLLSFVEHFVTPFIWCTSLQLCALYSTDRKIAISLPVIIYLSVVYSVDFIQRSHGTLILYLSPATIMASSYVGINSYGLFLGLLFPVICGLIAYIIRRKSLEI